MVTSLEGAWPQVFIFWLKVVSYNYIIPSWGVYLSINRDLRFSDWMICSTMISVPHHANEMHRVSDIFNPYSWCPNATADSRPPRDSLQEWPVKALVFCTNELIVEIRTYIVLDSSGPLESVHTFWVSMSRMLQCWDKLLERVHNNKTHIVRAGLSASQWYPSSSLPKRAAGRKPETSSVFPTIALVLWNSHCFEL